MMLDRLRDPIEALQWSTAQQVLRRGVSVILENGFWSKEERLSYRNKAKELGVAVELHYLNISRDELWRRIQKRNDKEAIDLFKVTEEELDKWLTWFTPPNSTESRIFDNFVEHRL